MNGCGLQTEINVYDRCGEDLGGQDLSPKVGLVNNLTPWVAPPTCTASCIMRSSLESQAFRKHFSELCIAISDPEWLASELFSMDMISNDALDEAVTVMGVSRTHRTRRVLCHFKGSLASNPEYFQKFISTLKSAKHLEWIANRMEATYSKPTSHQNYGDISITR